MLSAGKPRDEIAAARDAAASLFPPWAATAVFPVEEGEASAYPEERAAVARAVPARRAEFFAGRRAAHAALAALHADGAPVGRGSGREPLWPGGVVGSIAHSSALAAAVVAGAGDAWGIGLDVESLGPDLDPAIASLVLRADERAQKLPARVAFAIKECVFKCLFPPTGWRLGFGDVRVDVDALRGTFRAEIDQRFRLPGRGRTILSGRIATASTHVFAGAWVAPQGVSRSGPRNR